MRPKLHIRRFTGVVLTSVSLVLGSTAVAQANSIVYLKAGNGGWPALTAAPATR